MIRWLEEEERDGGPKGRIRWAIGARMSEELRAACTAHPEKGWQRLPDRSNEEGTTIREWASWDYVPGFGGERPVRYIDIRVRPRQGELFEDGARVRYVAVMTNEWGDGAAPIEWHRQKAGTVEPTHDELKNGRAGGSPSSQRFGANAAWFLLNAIVYNVISALCAAHPEAEVRVARIKQVR